MAALPERYLCSSYGLSYLICRRHLHVKYDNDIRSGMWTDACRCFFQRRCLERTFRLVWLLSMRGSLALHGLSYLICRRHLHVKYDNDIRSGMWIDAGRCFFQRRCLERTFRLVWLLSMRGSLALHGLSYLICRGHLHIKYNIRPGMWIIEARMLFLPATLP